MRPQDGCASFYGHLFQSRRPGFEGCDLALVTEPSARSKGFSPVDRDLKVATALARRKDKDEREFQSRRPGFEGCDQVTATSMYYRMAVSVP